MSDPKLASVLIAVVELLKEQGLRAAGEQDALLAYQVLSEAKAQANAYGVPLSDIGLGDFDPDELLNPNRKAA